MTSPSPLLRLRAILSRWDGGDQEEDRDWSAMGLTFARFIADPETRKNMAETIYSAQVQRFRLGLETDPAHARY